VALSSTRLIVAKLLEKSQPVYLTGFIFFLTTYKANNPHKAGCCRFSALAKNSVLDNLSLA
jgi:hypothetical protein